MSRHHVRLALGSAAIAGTCLFVIFSAHPRAVSPPPASAPQPQAATRNLVRLVPPGEPLPVRAGEKGATYFALEAQAAKVVTRYADVTAVAERQADGDVKATLHDGKGQEIARLLYDRVDGLHDTVQFATPAGKTLRAMGEPGGHATLDWANRQALILARHVSDPDAPPGLEWRDGFMQHPGASLPGGDGEIQEQEMTWANGVSTRTVRRQAKGHEPIEGRRMTGAALVSTVTKDGVQVGRLNYFPEAQLLLWDLPHLSSGYLEPKNLERFGGWPFTPDVAWLNLQAVAFYHFKTLIQRNRFVAGGRPGWGERLLQAVVPTLRADEEGCDGLHWLDGTVLRYCCDVHDNCYAKYGCESTSWWQVWSSWRCDACNVWVVDCFAHGGLPGVMMY